MNQSSAEAELHPLTTEIAREMVTKHLMSELGHRVEKMQTVLAYINKNEQGRSGDEVSWVRRGHARLFDASFE